MIFEVPSSPKHGTTLEKRAEFVRLSPHSAKPRPGVESQAWCCVPAGTESPLCCVAAPVPLNAWFGGSLI